MKIGLAEVGITPPVGTPLGGNYRDEGRSKGIFQNLYAHALVFDDGSKEISLVASDLGWDYLDLLCRKGNWYSNTLEEDIKDN